MLPFFFSKKFQKELDFYLKICYNILVMNVNDFIIHIKSVESDLKRLKFMRDQFVSRIRNVVNAWKRNNECSESHTVLDNYLIENADTDMGYESLSLMLDKKFKKD